MENIFQSRWKGQFCQQNKLAKSANFVSKFKAKHAIEEQSQCLEESQNCFESKVAEGFRFIDLYFLIEKGLRRGPGEGVAVHIAVEKRLPCKYHFAG